MFKNRKHSPETIEKMRKARLGKKRGAFSPEWRRNISLSLMGNERTKGRILSDDHKKKISLSVRGENHPLYGKFHSEAAKRKMSVAHKGQKSWNKGNKYPQITGEKHPFYGKKRSQETIAKIRHTKTGKGFGNSNPNWRGGATKIGAAIRASRSMQQWITDCMQRDSFSCRNCGDSTGGNLEVHHIIPFSVLVAIFLGSETSGTNLTEKSQLFTPFWDLTNGRTLCKPCHRKTDNFGTKARKFIKTLS